jgi:hypothetical protein
VSLPEERAARNEALFREVNEQVRSLSRPQPWAPDDLLIVCECSDVGCAERIGIERSEYEAIRANPRRFVVVSGHESDFEHVVDRGGRYSIVEKEGRAGRVAEQTDPRA